MPIKKNYQYFSSLNPKLIFNLILFVIVLWILAKPLHTIGFGIYTAFGTFINNSFLTLQDAKSNLEEIFSTKKLISEKNKEIRDLRFKLTNLEALGLENERLKKLLKISQEFSYKVVPANVVGRGPDNWHKQIILNKGTSAGIKVGDGIISEKGIVGQVVEVNKNNSTCQLISDPSFKIGCKIAGKEIIGILTGKSNSVGLLEFIPVGTKIKIRDKVVTSGISASGLSLTYPSGYPIGKVTKISKKTKNASDLYIEVKLFEDLTTLKEVLVYSTY